MPICSGLQTSIKAHIIRQ